MYTSCQTDMCSLFGHTCTHDNRLMFGVFMEISVHKIPDFVWSLYGDICTQEIQTDVWSLYEHICTPVFRVMCGVCMEISGNKLSDCCLESVLG
jgi:hypothetical protein